MAVLFDMDGTLIDSEKIWSVGLDGLANHYGGAISPPARAAMVGASMAASMHILHEDIGQPWRDPEVSTEWLENRVEKLYAQGPVWRPGARELLAAVRAEGLRSALVTATRRRLVEVALGTIGLSWFDVLVTGDEIVKPKPDPEPYLTAARLLGVDPSRCVAVEDSPAGLSSALAAGCTVIGVPCDVPLPEELGATILPSLEGVNLEVLRSLVWVSLSRSRT